MTGASQVRVCHLVSDDGWGGAEAIIRGLVEIQTREAGVSPSLVALNEGALVRFARGIGVEVRVVPERGVGFLSLLREIQHALTSLRPQIIHSHRYKENLAAFLLAPKLGLRSVVTLHGEEPAASRRARLEIRLRRLVSRALARRAHARYATVSRDLPALLGLGPSQWEWLPNGVALPADAGRFSAARSSGPSPPVIGWVGRLVPVKGLPLLLEAVAALPPALSKTRLLLVGEGPERSNLEERSRALGLTQRVEFRGFVQDPAADRARMDVFALPSVYEGVPMALLEAMGSGLPCVAAAVGGIPDALGPSRALRLVPSRSVEAWSLAIGDLLAQPTEAQALGAKARAYVGEHLSLGAVAARYQALYRQVLGPVTS